MPRALTEQEKCVQCQKLLDKGKAVVLLYGIRKVSVDDIAKAANMAKGTFYQHFEAKEHYLLALIEQIHHESFAWAKKTLFSESVGGAPLRESLRGFLEKLFALPEMVFFVQNEREIAALLAASPGGNAQSFKAMEEQLFAEILGLAGMNLTIIKPGVVHNLIHTLFMVKSSDLMVESERQQTLDILMNSLIAYLFGGEA